MMQNRINNLLLAAILLFPSSFHPFFSVNHGKAEVTSAQKKRKMGNTERENRKENIAKQISRFNSQNNKKGDDGSEQAA